MSLPDETIRDLLGLDQAHGQLEFHHLIVRAIVVCMATLAMIRLAGRRFLAQKNPFDVMLGVIVASMMSRAINGSAAFAPTLGTGFVLAGAYRFIALWTCKAHRIGRWLKGEPQVLVENGALRRGALNRHHISENDLQEDLQLNAVDDVQLVKMARIERNGEISVLRKPQIFEIRVENGVQTVRLLIE